jgi:hypothetical protein
VTFGRRRRMHSVHTPSPAIGWSRERVPLMAARCRAECGSRPAHGARGRRHHAGDERSGRPDRARRHRRHRRCHGRRIGRRSRRAHCGRDRGCTHRRERRILARSVARPPHPLSRLGRRIGEDNWTRAELYLRRRGGPAIFSPAFCRFCIPSCL